MIPRHARVLFYQAGRRCDAFSIAFPNPMLLVFDPYLIGRGGGVIALHFQSSTEEFRLSRKL
jgi:hypothetical protein